MAYTVYTDEIDALSQKLKELNLKHKFSIVTAESLTAGLISSSIVNTAGSSAYFDRAFAVYNNTAKHEMLGVAEDIFKKYTEVSGQCVEAMAKGALMRSHATLSCAVSGVAGPDGGTEQSPVGTVWFGYAQRVQDGLEILHNYSKRIVFTGSRQQVREQTVIAALKELIALIEATASN